MGDTLFGAQAAPGKDVAYTPDIVACVLVATLGAPLGVVWDPYGGGGAFGRAVGVGSDPASRMGRAVGTPATRLLTTDIDPAAAALTCFPVACTTTAVWDAGKGLPAGWPRPDWCISNPPFSTLDKHLPVLLETARGGVAMLIIGQWLAPGARDWLWDTARPDEVLWIRERIPFSGPGRDGTKTDQREYAWPIWRRQPDGGWMGRGLMGRVSWHTGKVWRAS